MIYQFCCAPVVLGDNLRHPFMTLNGSNAITAPDATPTYAIRTAAGLGDGTDLVTGTCSAISGITSGYYVGHAITTGNGFAAGVNYYIIITFAISATTRRYLGHLPVA